MSVQSEQHTYVDPDVVVAQFNFLEGLDREDVLHLLSYSIEEVTLATRQTLYGQDTPITHIWVLLEGRIAQVRRDQDEQGQPRQLLAREVQPGALLGVYEYLFDHTSYRTRARALEPCRLFSIEISALSRLIYRFPDLRGRMAPLPLIARLRTFPLLRSVDLVGLGFLADATAQADWTEDQIIYRAGDGEAGVFLVNQGQARLDWEDGQTDWVGNGGVIGLTTSVDRSGPVGERTMTHSATATMSATVLTIRHADFVALTGFVPDPFGLEEIVMRKRVVNDLAVFGKFTDGQRRHLTGFFSHLYFPVNHLLIQQGEEADSLWVLLKGGRATIRALDSSGQRMITAVATGPTYFGETALLGQIPQDSSIEADGSSEWLRLHWHDFEHFDIVEPDDLRALLQIRTKKGAALVGKEARKRYPWLLPGESVVYFSRRHWIAFLRKNIATIILFVLLLIFMGLGFSIEGLNVWIEAIVVALLLLTAAALAWGIADYMNDWLVVTDRRVVYQEKLLFVHQWRKEAPLEQIQNIDYRMTLLGRWLNFGTMIIQTAGTYGAIAFNYTTNFSILRKNISEQQVQRRRHAAAQSKTQIHRQLERRIGLVLNPPSRVYTGPLRRDAITGWQDRVAQRMGLGLTKLDDERIVWRKHWMALLPKIGWAWVMPFLILFMSFVFYLNSNPNIPDNWRQAGIGVQLFAAFLMLVFLARLSWVVVDWYNDTYEVTLKEVINVRKLPFGLREDRRSASLGRVQNVEMRIPSPIHWLLDYGNVIIQTAAEEGALVFYAVPNPRAVSEEILARMESFMRQQQEEEARRRAEDLPDWFEMYNRIEPETTI